MIPIAKPDIGEKEAAAAREVILSGWVTQGPKVKQFEEAFASYAGSKYACAVSSCTTALHLALLTVGVKPGDVVVTVSHSFIATANAVRHCGAEPVFVDIESETYNMSPEALDKCIKEDCEAIDNELFYKNILNFTKRESPLANVIRRQNQKLKSKRYGIGRVAAILPVHQMGMPCNLSAILRLANKFNIPVVEDAACAIGSEISFDKGRTWGKIGKPHGNIACFSFHPRKVITTGDGGMLVTNTPEFDQKFRLFRHQGMSVSDIVRHESKSIIFEEYPILGYNYRMTDIQAAIGIEQLKKLPKFIDKRKKIDKLYRKYLKDISWLKLPIEHDYARCNWQSYPVRVLTNSPVSRNELMQYLLDDGIATKPGIMNAHQEKVYSNQKSKLPESEEAREKVVLLPIYQNLSEEDIKRISHIMGKL